MKLSRSKDLHSITQSKKSKEVTGIELKASWSPANSADHMTSYMMDWFYFNAIHGHNSAFPARIARVPRSKPFVVSSFDEVEAKLAQTQLQVLPEWAIITIWVA